MHGNQNRGGGGGGGGGRNYAPRSQGRIFFNSNPSNPKAPQWSGDLKLTDEMIQHLVSLRQQGQEAKMELSIWESGTTRNGNAMMDIVAQKEYVGRGQGRQQQGQGQQQRGQQQQPQYQNQGQQQNYQQNQNQQQDFNRPLDNQNQGQQQDQGDPNWGNKLNDEIPDFGGGDQIPSGQSPWDR